MHRASPWQENDQPKSGRASRERSYADSGREDAKPFRALDAPDRGSAESGALEPIGSHPMRRRWSDSRDAARERVQRILKRRGYVMNQLYPRDMLPETRALIEHVRPFTMTSTEALAALCTAVGHLVRHEIAGSLVECGVWRGGSMMAVARTLLDMGVDDRDLYLFDTFEGMVPPTEHDVRVLDGLSAARPESLTPAIAVSQDEVAAALRSTGYPASRIHLVRGPVEETLPSGRGPESIALLRLDTDWYESTHL